MAFPSRRSTTPRAHWKPRWTLCQLYGVILEWLSGRLSLVFFKFDSFNKINNADQPQEDFLHHSQLSGEIEAVPPPNPLTRGAMQGRRARCKSSRICYIHDRPGVHEIAGRSSLTGRLRRALVKYYLKIVKYICTVKEENAV